MSRTPHQSLLQSGLIPQESPLADLKKSSLSGVRYETVFHGLQKLYPPADLDSRNALSRFDGYWPFVQSGKAPPKYLTYGEFDFYFFAELLDRAVFWLRQNDDVTRHPCVDKHVPTSDPTTTVLLEDEDAIVFCDLGSGTGRLVCAAAALHPRWRQCRGIEVLPRISEAAVAISNQQIRSHLYNNQSKGQHDDLDELSLSNAESIQISDANITANLLENLTMAPVEFVCGSFADPYVYFGDSNVIFCFSSCLGSDLVQTGLVESIGRQCIPGTIVITTDCPLPLNGMVPPVDRDDRLPSGRFQLRLLETIEGWCWLTGGNSTAYIHQVEVSLGQKGQGNWTQPVPSLEDTAFEIVRALEAGELTDTTAFLRNVYNNIIFNGLPESFLPENYSKS